MIEMVKYYVTRIADSGGFREQMMSFLGLNVVAPFLHDVPSQNQQSQPAMSMGNTVLIHLMMTKPPISLRRIQYHTARRKSGMILALLPYIESAYFRPF